MGFGQDLVKKIYKTDAAQPFEWYLTTQTNPYLTYEGTDTQLKLKEESEDDVGEKNVFSLPSPTLGGSNTKILYKSTTLTGFVNQNVEECSQRGHMVNPYTDFGSVEITYYIKHLSGSGDYRIGGPTCFDSAQGCQGMQYLSILKSNGSARLAKKQWYPSGVSYEPEKTVSASITGRWVGVKLCIIIMDRNRVRVEQYYDDQSRNDWRLVNSRLDLNNWGNLAGKCGAVEGMEGQSLGFKMPNVMLLGVSGTCAVQIKKASIRAIMDQPDDTSIPLPTLRQGATIDARPETPKSAFDEPSDRGIGTDTWTDEP